MRFLGTAALAALLFVLARPARADAVAAFARVQGGYGGSDTEELLPGGDGPRMGPAVGVEAGVRVLVLEAYVDRTYVLRGGNVTRAMLGLSSRASALGVRLAVRAGIGTIRETEGSLSGENIEGLERDGFAARLGVAADRPVTRFFLVGLVVEGEYYVVGQNGVHFSLNPGVNTGFDVLAGVRVTFEAGI